MFHYRAFVSSGRNTLGPKYDCGAIKEAKARYLRHWTCGAVETSAKGTIGER